MVFEYSFWWIIPILVISVGVARLKFKKISKLPDIPFGINLLVSSLRFLAVFLLLFLLLKPVVQFVRTVHEKPLLIVAQDNSASLLNSKDSLYFRQEYGASLTDLIARLEEKFTVERLSFGKQVKKGEDLTFSEHYTDISGLFDYIDNQYVSRRPEGILLLSDGKYNSGQNPRYRMAACPVYTVVLGDTTVMPDVFIREVACDKFNFLHTVFPLKVEVAAVGQKGKRLKCILKENGTVIAEKEISIERDDDLQEAMFNVEAKHKGLARYTVELETGFRERSRENNKAEVFVNILDNSGEITLYYTAPHPDIAAVADAIRTSGIYRCTVRNLSQPVEELKSQLLIFHNPRPESANYKKLMEMADKAKIPVWYMLTDRGSITGFARYNKTYSVVFNTEAHEYATPVFNRNFPYFEFTEQEAANFAAYPPVVVPFGQIKVNAGKNLLLQKMKNTVTDNGLMSFYDDGRSRQAYFWGEGFWKWRLFSYKENGSHDLFNTLVFKTVNYLATRSGGDRFIHDIRALYDETEEALINVELYNESYELVNDPDVKLVLKYGEKDFNYILNRNGDKYRINLGNLSAGEYSYILSAVLKGESFEKKGSFYVRTRNPELNDMVADAGLLKDIALNSGGESCFYAGMEDMISRIQTDNRFSPMLKEEMRYMDLGELGWIGMILLFLLCIEWFLLKYYVG